MGKELFNHLCQFARRGAGGQNVEDVLGGRGSSAAGDLEISASQREVLAPKPSDLTVGAILKTAGGQGAQMRLAQRKLDAAATVNAQCNRANAPERIRSLEAANQIAASLAEITRAETQGKQAKTAADAGTFVPMRAV